MRAGALGASQPVRVRVEIAPAACGTYALLFRSRPARIRVGALGEVSLCAGSVVYVGSAFGPGGLAGRLRHHLRPVERPRWHLDYLQPALEVKGAWIGVGARCAEHQWAEILAGLPAASLPRPRFGASDCRCRSHLVSWRRSPGSRKVRDALLAASDAEPVDFLPASRLRAWIGIPP